MYDVAIIGLGPAGATLARTLNPGLKVIAIDKKDAAEDSFHKPCGGLLAPDAQKALSRFNLTLPKDVLVDPQIFAVKTVDSGQNLTRYYRRFYMNLDRHRFDMWLISLIPGHAEVAAGSFCKSVERAGELFEITYIQNKAEKKITARYVVGADGSNSLVRKSLFPERKIRRYLSIQQWFENENQTPLYSCIFDREITDSYCWGVSKDGYFVLGGAFPVKGAKKRFALLKEKLKKSGFPLGEAVKTEACQVSMPRGVRDFCAAGKGAFLIGEAAGFISPTSLEGISYAMNSAYELAKVLNSRREKPEWSFRKKSIPIRIKLLLKYFKAPFMYNRLLRKIIMKSGIKSVDVMD